MPRQSHTRRVTGPIALGVSLMLHATLTFAAWQWGSSVPVPRSTSTSQTIFTTTPAVLPDDPFGTRGGPGEALADFEADQPLRSPHEAQDQPLLGLSEHGPLRPGQSSSARALAAAERAPALPSMDMAAALAKAMRTADAGPPAPPAPPPALPTEMTAEPEASLPAPTPEVAEARTDPGPAADREVSLFTKEAFTDYRAGAAIAREGRDHKIRGLRRGLTAFVDQLFLPRPITLRFVIEVDREGTPIAVTLEKSSGSDALDQAIRKELFNSWFDPDPSGTGADLGRPFHFGLRIH